MKGQRRSIYGGMSKKKDQKKTVTKLGFRRLSLLSRRGITGWKGALIIRRSTRSQKEGRPFKLRRLQEAANAARKGKNIVQSKEEDLRS